METYALIFVALQKGCSIRRIKQYVQVYIQVQSMIRPRTTNGKQKFDKIRGNGQKCRQPAGIFQFQIVAHFCRF
jgi:hypothetical protein